MVVAERRRVEKVSHPGRWLAAGAAALFLLIVAVWFGVPRESAEDREQDAANRACRRFSQLQRDKASGTLTRSGLLRELDVVAAEAAGAPASVREASARITSEARAGSESPAFDAAMTSVAYACGGTLSPAE